MSSFTLPLSKSTATLTSIITEVFLIDGYDYIVSSRYRDSLGYQPNAAKEALFQKYHISQADYDSSMYYYALHQKTFEEMMQRAINNLEKRKTEN